MMSGYNTPFEVFSSNSTEASHGNSEAGDNQSVVSDDLVPSQLYRAESPQEVGLDKLTLAI